jgi:uroporphyrinogen decarboxylase
VKQAVAERYGVYDGLDPASPSYAWEAEVAMQRFLGYDHVRVGVEGADLQLDRLAVDDTAGLRREGGRSYVNENRGPITSWEEFEAFPWPDPDRLTTNALAWYEENLPDDMCIIGGGGFGHYAEYLCWLMGYATFAMALCEQRDLVQALYNKIHALCSASADRILAFSRVKALWGSDDMGFRGGTLVSPDDMRAFVLPGHKAMAAKAHAKGLPYLLHSCGDLTAIMPDLLDDVGIDAKHSYEDVIQPVTEAKRAWGGRMAILGGIDVDFLCRADEQAVRARVRETLDACMPGGGYVLGTGNSVANYIPLDNYLAMLDEGRRWGA